MQPDPNTPRRRRKKETQEEVHQEAGHDESNWLVSYADMMTLLFGFFVLMYSFSRVDLDKFTVVSKDVAKYFGGKVSEPGFPDAVKVTKEIEEGLTKDLGAGGEFNVKLDGDSVILTLGSDVLFPSGSAQLSEKALDLINKIYTSIEGKKVDLIEVEGHTDADPITTALFPSNWELSTARASSVVRFFEQLSVSPMLLKATGYGSSRPMPEQKDKDGNIVPKDKKADRRVIISFKLQPNQSKLRASLEASGLHASERSPSAIDLEREKQAQTMQEKLDALNLKMKEAADRLAKAKEEQRRTRELEMLAKKAADMERKVLEIERKAQETMQQTEKSLQ